MVVLASFFFLQNKKKNYYSTTLFQELSQSEQHLLRTCVPSIY